MNSLEKKVMLITSLGHALCHVYLLVLAGALTTIAADMNLGLTQLTSLGTVSYFLFGLGALPAGLLVSKTNAKFVLKLFFLSAGFMSAWIGLGHHPAQFAIGLALLGLSASLYHVSGITLIAQTVRVRGKALGLHGVAGSAGIALSPLIAAAVLSFSDWRMIYIIMAVPGILGGVWLMSDREIPDAHPEIHAARTGVTLRHRNRVFVLALIAMAMNGFIYRGFLTMLPTYVMGQFQDSGQSNLSAGLLSTLILGVGMLGQYVGGHLSDRFRMMTLYFITVTCTIPFLVLLGYTSGIPVILSGIGFSLFHFPQQPVENHLISKWMPPKWVSSGYGIKFAIAFGAGSFASGGAGFVAEHDAISSVFPLLGLIAAGVSCIVWIIYRMTSQ